MYPETGNNDAKVYVGNLPSDTRVRDLEDIFYKYGKIRDVDLHSNRNPPFAFVEFEDVRDAEDAVHARDGYDFDGFRIRVEFPRSSNRGRSGPSRDRSGSGGRGGGRPFVRRGIKGYKCNVTGLPPTGSWQDLKDHFRECGDVIFTDVTRDGTGVVEFSKHEHMRRACRDLHDTKFRSHEGETAYIYVKESKDSSRSRSPTPRRHGSRSASPRRRSASPRRRSRSPSPPRRHSRSPSPPRRRGGKSRSRSRSPMRRRSRSRSRS